MANKSGFPPAYKDVKTITANLTLTAADSGTFVVANAVDLVVTLPSATGVNKGVWFDFVVQAPSVTTGLTIAPQTADKVSGPAITASAGKGIINSAATDALGDAVRLISDGSTGWWMHSLRGTWSRVP